MIYNIIFLDRNYSHLIMCLSLLSLNIKTNDKVIIIHNKTYNILENYNYLLNNINIECRYIEISNKYEIYKELYKEQIKIIKNNGGIFILNNNIFMIRPLKIEDEVFQKKIICGNNINVNKRILYINDVSILEKFLLLHEEMIEKNNFEQLEDYLNYVFSYEIDEIKRLYEEIDETYYFNNEVLLPINYYTTQKGIQDKENFSIEHLKKLTYKDTPVSFLDMSMIVNEEMKTYLNNIYRFIVDIDKRYYYIIKSSTSKLFFKLPIRSRGVGYWKNLNNSVDFIIKDISKKFPTRFEYNYLLRSSSMQLDDNCIIYDNFDDKLLDIKITTSADLILINTNKTTSDLLDEKNIDYTFICYTPYCLPLLEQYLNENNNINENKSINVLEYEDIDFSYLDTDIQRVVSVRELDKDIHEVNEFKNRYNNHLNNIKKSKMVHINTHSKNSYNTMVECMALGSVPIFTNDPKLIGLYENKNYLIKETIPNELYEEDYLDLINNNLTYYNNNICCEKILKNIMKSLIKGHTKCQIAM